MGLLLLLLVLAVLGVVAAVAAGRITGGMAAPASSLPARGLPEGPVRAADLDAVRFSPSLRGYRMDEVDAVLDRLAAEIDERDRRLFVLEGGDGAAAPADGTVPPWTSRPPQRPPAWEGAHGSVREPVRSPVREPVRESAADPSLEPSPDPGPRA